MSFFENNKKILIDKYPGLFEEIIKGNDNAPPVSAAPPASAALPADDLKIEITPAGDPTFCINGMYVHSQRDPAREGQRLADTAIAAGSGPVIILGFGLGYSAQAAAAAADPLRPVIIVEKRPELLAIAMEHRDLGSLFNRSNVIFILGGDGEGIMSALALAASLVKEPHTKGAPPASNAPSASETPASEATTPSVIRNRALIDLDKEWYGVAEDRIRTWTSRSKVNAATLNRFGRRWVRNLSRNMSAIRDCPGISRLAGLAAGGETAADADGSHRAALPVFLAAAGPSLDKIAPMLREIHRRCVIVAVDTNLRFFVKHGVQPDFVLVVDPQFWNSRHLDYCVCKERTRLIVESAVYPPVLRLPFKGVYLCGSLFPLGSFIEKQVDPKGQLGAGGSVATTAWDFARSLDSREIWIAGLDLSFPDLKTHFRGALFEDRSNSSSNRFNPSETWIIRALRDGFPFKAPSASGGQVLTDRRLSLYAAWFENRFCINNAGAQNENAHNANAQTQSAQAQRTPVQRTKVQRTPVRNYGLFQDGLAINGLEPAQAADLLALPDRREEIDSRLDAVFSKIESDFNKPEEKQKRAERYKLAVSVLIRGLESIRDAAEKGANITEKALKSKPSPEQQNKILKDLDDVTRRIANSEVKEVAGFLFPPVEDDNNVSRSASNAAADGNAHRGTSSGTHDPFRAYLESSRGIFLSLAETAAFNLENLGEKK